MHRRCKQSWKYTNAEWIERYYIITSFSLLDDTQNICKIALLGYVTVNVLDRFWRKQRKERRKETALINRQSLTRTGERWLIVHDDVFVLYTLAWYRMFNIERLKILRDHSQTTPVYFRFVHASSLYRKYVNSRIYLIYLLHHGTYYMDSSYFGWNEHMAVCIVNQYTRVSSKQYS